jgi:DNA-binding transcriptional LysR family regulator
MRDRHSDYRLRHEAASTKVRYRTLCVRQDDRRGQTQADPRVIEFRTSQAELAIRYSLTNTDWPRLETRHLARYLAAPVLAPSLLAAGPPLEQPHELTRHRLLHENGRIFWSVWMRKAGVENADTAVASSICPVTVVDIGVSGTYRDRQISYPPVRLTLPPGPTSVIRMRCLDVLAAARPCGSGRAGSSFW